MRWAGYAVRMEINAYKVLIRKTERKNHLRELDADGRISNLISKEQDQRA
jgi:hypothetical protein